jgi:hypothetical protein
MSEKQDNHRGTEDTEEAKGAKDTDIDGCVSIDVSITFYPGGDARLLEQKIGNLISRTLERRGLTRG